MRQQVRNYILKSLSPYITKPFSIYYQAFPYILPSIKRKKEELPSKYEYDYVVSFWMNQACGSKKNVKGNDVRDFFELSTSKTVKKVMMLLIFQCFRIKKSEKGNDILYFLRFSDQKE